VIDYLILGGGSAGCVLAARLSEDPEKTVCLIEAGRDISQANMPDAIRSRYPGRAYLDLSNIWQRLTAVMSTRLTSAGNEAGASTGTSRRYEQARLLGGGSAINALMANRGAPADYDEWEALGAHGWNWQTCLPYFRKLETDCDFDGELHGQQGPVRIQRTEWARVSPFVRAVLGALEQLGHPRRADQNGPWQDGTYVGSIAVAETGERIPTSVCYLSDAVRKRPNLTIRTHLLAERIHFEGSGAIHSPALLLRSGIGPATDLTALGIPLVADLPGVGRNLMEHPSIAVSAWLPRAGRTSYPQEHHEQAIVRFSSRLPDTVAGDMHGAILSRSGWHSIGYRLGTIFFWVNKSYSRGQLKLVSADPRDEPSVEFNMLSDPRDLERLKLAMRMGATTLAWNSMAGIRDTIFPSSYSPRVAKVAMPGKFNALQRGALSALLDVAGPLRGWLIRRLITQGVTIESLLADDAALTQFVTRSAGCTWHPSGTCRMGSTNDPQAVTDASGSVRNVEGLRVCDASLMPSIPCANTNIPTIMIAERIADMIRLAQPACELPQSSQSDIRSAQSARY